MIPWWLAVGLGVPLLSAAFIVGVLMGALPWHPRGANVVDLVGAKPSADVIALNWDEQDDRPRLHARPSTRTATRSNGEDAA